MQQRKITLKFIWHNYLPFFSTEKETAVNSFTTSQHLTILKKNPFENIIRKGENVGNQHFLLFPQFFPPFSDEISIFQ